MRLCLAILASLFIASPAFAETATPPAAAPAPAAKAAPATVTPSGGQSAVPHAMPAGARPQIDFKAMAEQRLEMTKKNLAITEAQNGPWNAYAETIRKRAATIADTQSRMMEMIQGKTPMARMDKQISMAEGTVTELKATKAALETLYGALTAEQKAKADQPGSGL
ncbi:MAG TPA: Spy/CpxP family protein refolding chaperone [Alphaproteobacteria bacterium]|nr:Spy/CpxP family protein refolding chaperone [Alphaproteobacteria bacterium]